MRVAIKNVQLHTNVDGVDVEVMYSTVELPIQFHSEAEIRINGIDMTNKLNQFFTKRISEKTENEMSLVLYNAITEALKANGYEIL